MVSITEIQEAIRILPETEYAQLRKWISDLDWERWDQQREADAEVGRLDFLIAEAHEAGERDAFDELWVHRATSRFWRPLRNPRPSAIRSPPAPSPRGRGRG